MIFKRNAEKITAKYKYTGIEWQHVACCRMDGLSVHLPLAFPSQKGNSSGDVYKGVLQTRWIRKQTKNQGDKFLAF